MKVRIKNPIWGVPVTFIYSYNPKQFEIVGDACNGSDSIYDLFKPRLNNKFIYKRILIRKKNNYES